MKHKLKSKSSLDLQVSVQIELIPDIFYYLQAKTVMTVFIIEMT